jgi:hypothetical protein
VVVGASVPSGSGVAAGTDERWLGSSVAAMSPVVSATAVTAMSAWGIPAGPADLPAIGRNSAARPNSSTNTNAAATVAYCMTGYRRSTHRRAPGAVLGLSVKLRGARTAGKARGGHRPAQPSSSALKTGSLARRAASRRGARCSNWLSR